MRKLLIILLGIFLINLAFAQIESLGTFQQGSCIEIKQVCASCTYVNITVSYPNSSFAVYNEEMTKIGSGTWNYSFCNTNTTGRYDITGEGDLNGIPTGFSALYFEITPNGLKFDEGQGFSSIGLFLSIIAISFLFMYFGFKFSENNKTFPIGLFFLIISLFVSIYALHLGYIMTRDILYPISIEKTQFKIYLGIMWGLIAVAFLGLLSLIIKTLKEIRVRKSIQSYGSNWNPKTKQYEY